MFRHAFAFAACLLSTAAVFAQSRPPIEGVWRVAEIVITGASAVNNTKPQPGLWIFTKGHYSQTITNGAQARRTVQYKVPDQPTDAEKLARYEQWQPFAANSGTYEIKGSTLTRRPIVAKNVEVQTGQPASEARMRLMRVE